MNEKALIEQVLRIINSNYSNIYVIDIESDKVYVFDFTVANSLVVKETLTYTDFIDVATKFIHKDEVGDYFNALSLNKLVEAAIKGSNETKVKYRKLCETGEYRWFVNIINYLPFEGRKLIFMMSEDINERLVDSEEERIKLQSEVVNYKTRIESENQSISDAIVKINEVLDNTEDSSVLRSANTKEYINSIFNSVSQTHPELNKAIVNKVAGTSNYIKPSILIVDDSSIIRNSLKRIFDKDYNIIMAKDGNEAIDVITHNILSNDNNDKQNIVGILLDLIMPVCDGFKVLDFLKNYNLLARIPVAIISGDETRETRKRVYTYDIVDMLEKPFNTEFIRTRINKIISLYLSSNNLQSLLVSKRKDITGVESDLKIIVEKIVGNITTNAYSTRLKKLASMMVEEIQRLFPKYNIDARLKDAIVDAIPLYNIGAIAIKDDEVVTRNSLKKEIEYGLKIASFVINDKYTLDVANNIIKYSCEMFNGSGYPDGIKGDEIPIEAGITNLIVRLCSKGKITPNVIKTITEEDKHKYNPDLIEALNNIKKEIKKI